MLKQKCISLCVITTRINRKKKSEPKKRRVYISLDRDILDSIDSHIDKHKTSKPAQAYLHFINSTAKGLLDKARIMIMSSGLDKNQTEQKLKKTYKNRFLYSN